MGLTQTPAAHTGAAGKTETPKQNENPIGKNIMNTNEQIKYYAVVAADLQGPAYGIGTSEGEAYESAGEYGFETGPESDTETCIEITRESYLAVANGNPDAWGKI